MYREYGNASASIDSPRDLAHEPLPTPALKNNARIQDTNREEQRWIKWMNIGTGRFLFFQSGSYVYPTCCMWTCHLRRYLSYRRCCIERPLLFPVTVLKYKQAFVKTGLEQPHPHPDFRLFPQPRPSEQRCSNDQIL